MLSAQQKNIITQTLKPFNPVMIGIFGSFARNENKKDSDLDILVEFKGVVNLLDLIGLEMELSEKLGIKVDLITKKSISPLLEPRIKKDLQRIL